MGLYVTNGGAVALSGLYVEESGVGDLGKKRRWKKAMPFIYGAASVLAVQKFLSPSIKTAISNYRRKRKDAKTAADIAEVARLRNQMMSAAPELFSQQPGMPAPAQIMQAIEQTPAGQPIPIQVKKVEPEMRPMEREEREPKKLAIPTSVYIAGSVGILTALKLLKIL